MITKSISYPLIEEEAKKSFLSAPPTHDFTHTTRVLNMCLGIGRKEGADLEILYAAALLHDIARFDGDLQGECHAELSARKARFILEKADFPEEKKGNVIHCIAAHRFRSDLPPQTLEAKILYDCDKLDAIGAIGICRAYAYCGENGQRLYSSFNENLLEDNPSGKRLSKFTDHSRHNPIIEFQMKLSKIKDKLFTASAKKMADSRHRYMLRFFNHLAREIKGNQ